MLVYEEYLKSPQWRDVRAQVIARAGGRCQINADHDCQLHVHHRSYESVGSGGEDEVNDCIAVCALCHERLHELIDEEGDDPSDQRMRRATQTRLFD